VKGGSGRSGGHEIQGLPCKVIMTCMSVFKKLALLAALMFFLAIAEV
jgi:hypothetical protein